MNTSSAPGVPGGAGSASNTPAAAAAAAAASAVGGSSGTSPTITPGNHPIQPRPLPQQAHAHVAPTGSGYLAGTGYGGPPAPAYPPTGRGGVGPIPPPPPTLPQIRAVQAQQARWVEREMAMAAQQAAISARQQQQQATLIELEQARVRRALATYAATGTIPPGATAAGAAAGVGVGVGAGGLSAAAASGAAVGAGASNSSALYGRTGASTPVAQSGAKRPGGEGVGAAAAAAPSGGGSHPSTPQTKKQKIAVGTGGTGRDNEGEVIVIDGSKSASPSNHTHRVLQTGLAGPFVRGVLADDDRTLATFRSQIGMGPRYFASQILNLAETPFRKDSIVIKMSNIDQLGLRISDGHNLYTKHAVEITSEEMRRKHLMLVAGMEERIKQLEDEVASARNNAGNKSKDKTTEEISSIIDNAAIKKAEEEYKKSIAATQANHAEEISKLKEKHEETVQMLQEKYEETVQTMKTEIREAKATHSRTLNSYLQASCEVLKLVRKEEKARLI